MIVCDICEKKETENIVTVERQERVLGAMHPPATVKLVMHICNGCRSWIAKGIDDMKEELKAKKR